MNPGVLFCGVGEGRLGGIVRAHDFARKGLRAHRRLAERVNLLPLLPNLFGQFALNGGGFVQQTGERALLRAYVIYLTLELLYFVLMCLRAVCELGLQPVPFGPSLLQTASQIQQMRPTLPQELFELALRVGRLASGGRRGVRARRPAERHCAHEPQIDLLIYRPSPAPATGLAAPGMFTSRFLHILRLSKYAEIAIVGRASL